MTAISSESIKAELVRYGVTADDRLCALISAYIDLLLRWNSKISLTTVTDPIDIVRFHFGESLFALSTVPISFGRLADVGSGAGFPGLALRMACPGLVTYLIEPNLKKAAFLSETVRVLGMKSVEVLRFRMEDLPIEFAEFDFISARAVGHYDALLRWSRNRLNQRGQVVLWVGKSDATLIQEFSDWLWKRQVRIPDTQSRIILTGSPNRP